MFSSSASSSRDRKRLLRIVCVLVLCDQRKRHDLVLGLAARKSGYEPDCWVCQRTNPMSSEQNQKPRHKSVFCVGCCFEFRIVRAGRTMLSVVGGSSRRRLIRDRSAKQGWRSRQAPRCVYPKWLNLVGEPQEADTLGRVASDASISPVVVFRHTVISCRPLSV